MIVALNIYHLLTTYGYAALFLLIGLESLGVPLPGETTLITAALYAGSTHNMNIVAIIVVASAAAIIGDNAGYAIGSLGGYRLLQRYGRYVRIDEAKRKVGRYFFDRHGGKVVFFGRFISILRTYAAFLAGTNHMRWPRFLVYNAAGGAVWATLYGASAYAFGAVIHRVGTLVAIVGGVLAAAVALAALLFMRRRIRTFVERAEQAYPGPLDDRPGSR